jgi:hypothetical protein
LILAISIILPVIIRRLAIAMNTRRIAARQLVAMHTSPHASVGGDPAEVRRRLS